MSFLGLEKSWETVNRELWFYRALSVLLAMCLFLALWVLRDQDTAVVIMPPTLTTKGEIARSKASQSVKESWSLYLSQLLGNVTPDTAEFVSDNVGPLLDPLIYSDVINVVEKEIDAIKRDRVSQRFEPRRVVYEPETDKVFVTGFSFVKGVGGEERRFERTYEFHWFVRDYGIRLDEFANYRGRPKTLKELARNGEGEEP